MNYRLLALDYWSLWKKEYPTKGVPGQPDVSVHTPIDRSDFNSAIGEAEDRISETLDDPTIEFTLTLGGQESSATLDIETDHIEKFDKKLIIEKINPLFRKWMKD